jgi:hypothetical protein
MVVRRRGCKSLRRSDRLDVTATATAIIQRVGKSKAMHYRVFYLFERSGEAVSSMRALEVSRREIREQLLPRLQHEDDYLGIIDSADNTLQILREPGMTRYWVELPIEDAKASYGKHMDRSELEALIQELPPVFDRDAIPGLEYRPW